MDKTTGIYVDQPLGSLDCRSAWSALEYEEESRAGWARGLVNGPVGLSIGAKIVSLHVGEYVENTVRASGFSVWHMSAFLVEGTIASVLNEA